MWSSKELINILNPSQWLASPDAVIWLCERLIGFLGLLRAISAAVLGDCFPTSCSSDDTSLVFTRPLSQSLPSFLGPPPFPRMTVSFNSTVAPTVLLVSVATTQPRCDPLERGWGSVCMAVLAVRSALLRRLVWSSVETATSTISEAKTGEKRTWESPLRELRGVLEDKE